MTTIAQFITKTQASFGKPHKQRKDKGMKRAKRIALIGAGLVGAGAIGYGIGRMTAPKSKNYNPAAPVGAKRRVGMPPTYDSSAPTGSRRRQNGSPSAPKSRRSSPKKIGIPQANGTVISPDSANKFTRSRKKNQGTWDKKK
jgi:hypothetical protein